MRVTAELVGAEVGSARAGDLDRAVRAAARAAGQPLGGGTLAHRLRTAPASDPVRRAFVEALSVSETHFFRIRAQFEAFAERVLPALLVARRRARRLRLWSAGCSTGEEAWSLAILVERLVPPGWDVTVLGTDVDEAALERARRGVYGPRSFREAPGWVRSGWFTPTADGWEVDARLRRRVRFAALNLATDAYPSPASGTDGIDLLLCRNVFIYFTPDARARTTARLSRCLAPGGWLALAPAELSLAPLPDLDVRYFPAAILHQRADPAAPGPRSGAAPAGATGPAARPHGPERPPGKTTAAPSEAAPGAAGWLDEARACADRGDRKEAGRLIEAALEADPLLAPGRELRAQLLLEGGDDEGAEGDLRAALFLDPGLAVTHATLGALLARRGERSRATAAGAEVRRLLAGRASGDSVPGAGGLTVGRLLADLDTWDHP
ncbi:MAG: chemotaxis protein methyltransferase CheR [Actinomycetota bacterium]|nr:chemotaxis protein methyltransferase CheR [Actinomycetota bacterium]